MDVLTKTSLNLKFLHSGKVRDTYAYGGNLLIVSTDRISAFDCVFSEGIPRKGEILNRLSIFWFKKTQHIVPNHFLSDRMPSELSSMKGRAMIVQKAEPVKIEAVVRGYLTGSGWKEYEKKGTLNGVKLPPGLKNGSKLEHPMFTPTTKAEQGHDISLTVEEAREKFGEETVDFIKEKAIALYEFGRDFLLPRGLVLADTKFEFGKLPGGAIILIDEAFTPDSSRYWLKEQYDKGILESMDKQFLRDYLEKSTWNKEPPAPKLPPEIVQKTSERYQMAYKMITGENL